MSQDTSNVLSSVWDKDHYLTDLYPGGTKHHHKGDTNPIHTFDLCWSDEGWEPVLGLGLYKVSVIREWENNITLASFQLDYRTSTLPQAAGNGNIDVIIDYGYTSKCSEQD